MTKEENRALCERYPFLIPSNRWSGMRITEAADGGYWPRDPEAIFLRLTIGLSQLLKRWRKN